MKKIEELEAKPFVCGGGHFTQGYGFFKGGIKPAEKLKKQSELHKKIRNDEDYDDWEYGTEPIYD